MVPLLLARGSSTASTTKPIRVLFFALSLIVTMTASNNSYSSLASAQPAAGNIINQDGELCPAFKWTSGTPGPILQNTCSPKAKVQLWTFQPVLGVVKNAFQIIAKHRPTMCMGVLNGSRKDGVPIVLVKCDSSRPEQVFTVKELVLTGATADNQRYFQLIPSSSNGKCVGQSELMYGDQTRRRLEQTPCNANNPKQNWNIQAELLLQEEQPPSPVEDGDTLRKLIKAYTDTTSRPLFADSEFAKRYGYPIGKWDVSRVTNFSHAFFSQRDFNEDISKWNTSSAVIMNSMFLSADEFNGDISVWDVSKVRLMNSMFVANKFNGDLSKWDVSRVRRMNLMFAGGFNFNGDISTWDVARVTSMISMFSFATKFNGDLSRWNVSQVRNMRALFARTDNFNGDLSMWDVSGATSMRYMFNGAKAFNGNLSKWNVSRVVDMKSMFRDTKAFNSDISSWNVARVNRMNRMFEGATKFKQNLCEWGLVLTRNVTVSKMFDSTTCPAKASKPKFSKNDSTSPPGPFCFVCK